MSKHPECPDDSHFRITHVKKHKKRRASYHIYLNDVYAYTVHEEIILKHHLFVGEKLSQQQIDIIKKEDEQEKANSQAIRFLGIRPRSTFETVQYLQRKDYPEELCNKVVSKLENLGYLDDERFAIWWTEQRILNQKKGRKWVVAELRQKGISTELIHHALEQIDDQSELDSAIAIALKKWNQLNGTELEKKRKLAMYLVRNGYSMSLVTPVIQAIRKQNLSCDN